ncbi:MlaA family lipoprotein [Thalassotalea piscium]|uniref:Phospholipid-binding lipoprotein MlaA n=1 Tax=Thalassotalea piscium TaxID=1230533 RepID=A0A7X0TUP5_9GAMM|nr:VacJ family lipoprotein [Thalassotalea piscium]MBB6544364.1 phospholipid-binding lipoprotein MlaA [Thalassotalea piscium]
MIKIIKRTNLFIRRLNRQVIYTALLVVAVMLSSGCSSKQEHLAEATVTNEQPVKGPYEIAAEKNLPSVVSYQAPEDSLRFINEPIFNFNDTVYRYVLSPLANGYQKVVPKPVDNSIRNFFYNLREPLYAVNHLLQGEVVKSGKSLARVLMNSTIGLLGLFDPANSMMELTRDKTTFGETLASYGVGHGAYIVLPLLGPSDLRDTASLSFNYLAHPLNFISDEKAAQQLLLTDGIQAQIPILAKYPRVLNGVDNSYEFTRNLYMQSLQRDGQERRNEVFKTEKQKQSPVQSVSVSNQVVE